METNYGNEVVESAGKVAGAAAVAIALCAGFISTSIILYFDKFD